MATPAAIINVGINQSYLANQMRQVLSSVESTINQKGINLKINEQSFRQPLGRITGDANQFSKSLEAATARVVAFSATLGIISGAVRVFKQLIDATIDVEKKLKDINSVFGLSSSNLLKFKRELFDVARDTGQSFNTAAEAALEFSRQGLSAAETANRVTTALQLTRLSGLEVTKSVDVLTSTLNAFNQEGLKAEDVLNKLIAVDSRFSISSKDLAEALARVGSTAQDAGVRFDKLLGIVTAARQITGRTGDVIGNALKTIFTRVQDSNTLQALEGVGIAIRNLDTKQLLDADVLLQNLAKSFDNLTQAQQQQVAKLTAGVFQINQFRAIMSDLARDQSFTEDAFRAASAASNEAIKRNEALNASLATLIQNARTTATELGSIFGNIAFADPLRKLFSSDFPVFDTVIQGLRKIETGEFETIGQEMAAMIGKGVMKGIGNILTGPALSIATVIGGKLVFGTASKLGEVLKNLTNNTKLDDLNRGIDSVISKSTDLERRRFLAADTVAKKEQVILEILERQAALTATISGQRIQNSELFGNNVSEKRFLRRLGRANNAADGYIPEAVAAESSMISRGVGGASTSARPVVIPNFNYGGGKRGTIVANSDEYIVPNYANGGAAIFNQEMIRSIGLPAGAKRIAADGYIPNFAGPIGLRRGALSIGEGNFGRALKTEDGKFIFKAIKSSGAHHERSKEEINTIIREEYAISKLAQDLGLPVAKVFGSAKRSVARGGLYKEYIDGISGDALTEGIRRRVQSTLSRMFQDKGIEPIDLRAPNFMIRKGANLSDEASVLQNAVVVDPGLFIQSNGDNAGKYNKHYYSKAGGYVPGLGAAIKREMAAGVASNQIYVDRDSRVASSGNPLGLLVANRRDEPAGGFQGVNRVINQGGDPLLAGAATGYVPNFAFRRTSLRTDLNNAGFEGRGMYINEDQLKNINSLFSALKKASDIKGLDKIADDILAFADGLDKTSKKKVENKLGEVYPNQLQNINNQLFAAKIFYSGVNKFGQTATPPIIPGQIPTPPNGPLAPPGAGGANNPMPYPYLGPTWAERVLKKNLYGLSEGNVLSLRGGVSQGRDEDIQKVRRILSQSSLRKLPGGATGVNSKLIDTVIGLDSSSTLREDFVKQVQKDIASNGTSLSVAMGRASKDFIDAGGTAKQLKRAILHTVGSLAAYDKDLKERQATAEQATLVNRATRQLESGATLRPGSREYNALIEQARQNTKSNFLSSIGKTENDALSKSEARKLALAQAVSAGSLARRLTAPGLDEAGLFKELQKRAGNFGNIDKAIAAINNSRALTPIQQEALKGQGAFLRDQRTARLGTASMIASIGLPFIGGFIPEGRGGTSEGVRNGALSGALTGAGTGAAIGQFLGPIGALVGLGAGGLIGGLIGGISKMKQSFEELAESLSEMSQKNKAVVNSASEYVQAQSELEDAIRNGATDRRINQILDKQRSALSALPSQTRGDLLSAGNNFTKLQNVLSGVGDSAQKEEKQIAAVSSFGALAKESNAKNIKDSVSALAGVLNGQSDNLEFIGRSRLNTEANLYQMGSRNKRIISSSDLQNLLRRTELSPEAQDSAFKQLKEIKPDKLVEIFDGLFKTLQSTEKLKPIIQALQRSSRTNVDLSRELNQYARSMESFLETQRTLNNFSESIGKARFDTGLSLGGLTDNQALGFRSAYAESAAQRNASFQYNQQLRSTQIDFIRDTNGTSLENSRSILNAKSAADFKEIISKGAFPDAIRDKLTESVNRLTAIDLNGKLTVKEVQETNKLQALELRAQQQGKLLSNGTFNPGATAEFGRLAVTGRLQRSGRFGAALGADDKLQQLAILDQLGIPRSEKTAAREEALRGISVRATLSSLIEEGGGGVVGTSDTDLRSGAQNLRSKGMGETATRIEEAIKLLPENFNRAAAQSDLLKGGAVDLEKLVNSGGLSLETGALKVPLDSISKHTEESALILADIAVLLEKRDANNKFTSLQSDLAVASLQAGTAKGIELKSLKNNNIDVSGLNKEQANTKILSTLKNDSDAQLGIINKKLPSAKNAEEKQALIAAAKVQATTETKAQSGEKILADGTVQLKAFEQGADRVSKVQDGFFAGFRKRIKEARVDLENFSDIGYRVADTLENSLGNAFGDFVTGAKSGREAFREFALSVLGDASRAFASKAVQGLISQSFGMFNTGGPVKLASGGRVPALLTGGEFYVSPEATQMHGMDFWSQINSGTIPTFAGGGLVTGGSGVRDDVPANLPANSYIVKKSAVEKYGADYLQALADGHVQKRFLGGMLLGGLFGGLMGYAKGGKKGALIGGLLGGIGGGLLQNFSQTGSVFKAGEGSGLFSFAKAGVGTAADPMLTVTGGMDTAAAGSGVAQAAAAPMSPWKSILGSLGMSTALGLGANLFTPKGPSLLDGPAVSRNREAMEASQAKDIAKMGKFPMMEINPQGGYSIVGTGGPATRRFANGGNVEMINRATVSNIAPLPARYAEGGPVASSDSPSINIDGKASGSNNINISITINNEGQVSSQNDSGPTNDEFARNLSSQVEGKVIEVLTKQNRTGGFFSQRQRI